MPSILSLEACPCTCQEKKDNNVVNKTADVFSVVVPGLEKCPHCGKDPCECKHDKDARAPSGERKVARIVNNDVV